MPEMGTSGLMSGDGKRGGRSASVLAPILDCTDTRGNTIAAGIEMSRERSLAGRSLAAGTSARPILCFQWFAPRFLESLISTPRVATSGDAARKRACATYAARCKVVLARVPL